VLPDAEPPDMASVDSPPLAELRAEAQAVRATNIVYAGPSPYGDAITAAANRVVKARLMMEARLPEIMVGLMLRERLHGAFFKDEDLEWIVPASYEWGERGAEGTVYGIPIRIVDGTDRLYLALKVAP
jgi:hypothetical protein